MEPMETWVSPEVKEAITEWEKETQINLTMRERAVFQFGFMYGQRYELQQNVKG